MARLLLGGAEMGTDERDFTTGSGSIDTVTVRSGLRSWKLDASGETVVSSSVAPMNVASQTYFFRAYIQFTTMPTNALTTLVAMFNNAGSDLDVKITSGGALRLIRGAATQIGSDSSALTTGTWYRIEVSGTIDGTAANITAAELLIDGVSVASGSGFSQSRNGGQCAVGFVTTPTVGVMYVDDGALNDSTGAANNSWPGSGKCILMLPVSDNNRGAWTQGAGAGGTTNLWDAVNNVPPVGVADASATSTSQIKNRTTTNPSNCDLNLDSYATAGLGASDTVNAIVLHVNSGEDPATGTKAGTVAMVSNPAIATTSFNFGNDAGTQGTYLGNWFWTRSAVTQAPSVTIASAPVIRVTCVSGATGSRSASCDFLASYIDYTPAATARVPRSPGVDSGNAHLAKAWQTARRWRHSAGGIFVPETSFVH